MQIAVQTQEQKTGLLYWAQRVLEESDKASFAFAPDPVHDLRVAIRRCRSMADGFISLDPDRRWRQMKRLAKPLFTALGELRDTQIMLEWMARLSPPEDHVAAILLETIRRREEEQRRGAEDALHAFDRHHWMELNRELAGRTAQVPVEGLVFQFLALERLHDAHVLHRRAMRNRSSIAYHQLRIGIKRFRYTVENFLPARHKQWSKDLRFLQDALGDIHDLDVLWAMIRSHTELPAAERTRWHEIVSPQREQRLRGYRDKMLGRQSLWHLWQSELPRKEKSLAASLEKLRTWADFLRTPTASAKRTAKLAMLCYDELARAETVHDSQDARSSMLAASMLHDIGASEIEGGAQKRAFRMIRSIPPPLGWSPQKLLCVATIVRHSVGKLPRKTDAASAGITAAVPRDIFIFAGILRLAHALDSYAPPEAEITAHCNTGALTVRVAPMEGEMSRAGERLARAKYLLEASARIAVVIETVARRADDQ